MKILYIANIRLPTEKAHGAQIMNACESLVWAGHEIELMVPRRRNTLSTNPFDYYGVLSRFPVRRLFTVDLVRELPFGFLLQTASFLIPATYRALSGHADIIYSRDEAMLLFPILLGAKNTVWESHDGAWNWAARFVAHRAKKVITVTEGGRTFYISKGITKDKILALPNGVDVGAFAVEREEGRKFLGIQSPGKVVLYAGALDGWKGTDTLFASAAFLPSSARVVVVGGQPRQIQALAPRYPTISFIPQFPPREMGRIVAAADVCVLPNTGTDPISITFTCPLKLLAYMAAGKPIVASDLPSIRELVGHDAALLVPPDNPQALADGIQRLLEDSALASRLGARARAHARIYDWAERAARLSDFIAS